MKIAVGISGGVDSAVAAYLLKEEGHDVTGVLMSIWNREIFPENVPEGKGCCTPDNSRAVSDAEAVCEYLDIPFRQVDCSKEFSLNVMNYFRTEYLSGRTPNPCVMCNSLIKFDVLPEMLASQGVGFAKFATGHYCRIEEKDGRFFLKKGINSKKDQSYFLYRLSQQQLGRILFPLGGMTKQEVRKIAESANLPVKFKSESQDFYSGDYGDLISAEPCPGKFVHVNGKILGEHRGIWNYTVGQRRGLGVPYTAPLYVVKIDKETNTVVLGEREYLKSDTLTALRVNMIYEKLPERAQIKIRSASEPADCTVVKSSPDSFTVKFDEPQFAVTPGQSAVIYDGDYVAGGGIIE